MPCLIWTFKTIFVCLLGFYLYFNQQFPRKYIVLFLKAMISQKNISQLLFRREGPLWSACPSVDHSQFHSLTFFVMFSKIKVIKLTSCNKKKYFYVKYVHVLFIFIFAYTSGMYFTENFNNTNLFVCQLCWCVFSLSLTRSVRYSYTVYI